MEILDGVEPHFPRKPLIILSAREFGYNSQTASLALQRDVPRREENIHNLLQEFDMQNRSVTIETNFQFNRGSFTLMRRHILAVTEGFDGKLETILLKLEKMNQLVKQPSKKHLSDQRAFIEALIEWVAVKSIDFRSASDSLFREMIQHANPDFSVSVYNTLGLRVNLLPDVQ
jgi:hypothetical protein